METASRVEHIILHANQQAEAEEAVRALERECEVLKAALTRYVSTLGDHHENATSMTIVCVAVVLLAAATAFTGDGPSEGPPSLIERLSGP